MHLRINLINGEKHPAAKWPCLSQVEKISASLNLALKSRYFLRQNLQDNHSNESWNWFVNSSIPRTLSPFFENFHRRFSRPDWPPLGLQEDQEYTPHAIYPVVKGVFRVLSIWIIMVKYIDRELNLKKNHSIITKDHKMGYQLFSMKLRLSA